MSHPKHSWCTPRRAEYEQIISVRNLLNSLYIDYFLKSQYLSCSRTYFFKTLMLLFKKLKATRFPCFFSLLEGCSGKSVCKQAWERQKLQDLSACCKDFVCFTAAFSSLLLLKVVVFAGLFLTLRS